MELRHLRYVLAVAEQMHFGRAAERLGISQPPLSQQIQAVERELGVALFERSSRQVRLTAAGTAFLPHAREAVAQAELAATHARKAGAGETGRLAIGFVGTSTQRLLPRILQLFRAGYPDVTLELYEHPTAEQVTALRADRLDLGFLRPPLTSADAAVLSTHVVGREPLVAALPASHRLAGARVVPLDRLAGEPFVLFPRDAGPGLYDLIEGCCRRAGFTPRIGQTATEMQTIVGLVATGFGVSLVPASVADGQSRVAFRPVAPAPPPIELALAWRVGDDRPTVANFRRLVRDAGTPPDRAASGA